MGMTSEQPPHRLTGDGTARNSRRNRFTPQMVAKGEPQELRGCRRRLGVTGSPQQSSSSGLHCSANLKTLEIVDGDAPAGCPPRPRAA